MKHFDFTRKNRAAATAPRLLAVCALAAISAFAVDKDGAMYVGGTLSIPEKTEGQFVTANADAANFTYKRGVVAIPYKGIETIEYGQKAGRRIAVAIMVSPIALLSKKRKHFLTLGYKDAHNAKQGIVIELGKESVRSVLKVLETRSGKKVEYESEDARKNIGN